MIYKNFRNTFSTVFAFSLFAALLSAGLMINSDVAAVKTVDNSADSVKRDEKAIEYLKQNGSYDSLAEAVTAARYKIEQNGETLGANNPANQMRTQFAESGDLRLFGAAQNSDWQTIWKLKSIGRGDFQTAVGGGNWQVNETRAELRRAKIGLTEYFENRPDGLEQGFILDEKPTGEENLRLILQTSGELQARASADGQTINLSDETGAEVLRYEKLKVWDAENKYLMARMTTNETGEITLEVEDAGAVYPLMIDPTFVQSQKLTANDGAANHHFGTSVAVSGDTMVVGAERANSNKGAVYVFVRSGNSWTQQARLVANDGAANYLFGKSVAISGDTIVVGSPNFGANSENFGGGAAYVFIRNNGVWSPQEKFYFGNQQRYNLGTSVSISGDTAVVGARLENVNSNLQQGAAYVFVRSGGAWTQQQRLTVITGTENGYFGQSVSIAGGTLLVGASNDSSNPTVTQGFVYVFTRSGTTWTQQARLSASDGGDSDSFGNSIDFTNTLTGTVAVIGAYSKDVAGNSLQGAAYIFTRSGTTWTQQQKLIASDGGEDAWFGQSVSIAPTIGNTVIIGAFFDDIGSNNRQGSAYIFKRNGSVWTQQQKLTAADGAALDGFGTSVAITSDMAVVSAEYDDVGVNSNQGSAYIFNLGSTPFDFDGDGKTDIGIFRPNVGEWWINRSSNGTTFALQFGQSTDRITPADYTGDGKTDIAFWRPSNGQWFVLRSEDNSFYAFPFGASSDVPVPADYDGDGKADAAVFRESTLTWFISKSSGGTDIIGFGASGDKPVIGDYDGDGKADIAIFRPNVGEWWIRRSSNASVFALQFGISTDKPVQADYTGDGKADIAFWRPSNGNWFVLRSEDFSFYAFPFGASGDTPVPGDYDGDGKFDAGVFRPTDSTWYVQRTTAGTLIQQFGIAGDKPVPSAFVP